MSGKKMGRPRIDIDLELAEQLGEIMCTLEECAAVMGINISTLSMRADFLEAHKRGKEKGKASLRRLQWQGANSGNPTMLIWMGKQHLGQSDKRETRDLRETPEQVLKDIEKHQGE